ncbi:uncharacterized protein LOC111701295, partial [Eurytemora carolleeae]|uniref:uncharacterized protein LOC111701295 n=1 Tax=Eurytemora carolleeae TaxID=1294199 RepID=UPI000C784863
MVLYSFSWRKVWLETQLKQSSNRIEKCLQFQEPPGSEKLAGFQYLRGRLQKARRNFMFKTNLSDIPEVQEEISNSTENEYQTQIGDSNFILRSRLDSPHLPPPTLFRSRLDSPHLPPPTLLRSRLDSPYLPPPTQRGSLKTKF